MTDKPVRTRFAPSPTGPLHIGSARTVLFSWLYARRYGGQFILRVEDTDQKRFIEGSIEQVMNGIQWLGLDWDEGPDKGGNYGPYTQSERLELYQQWSDWLIEHDKAYKCYCSSERLAQVSEERRERGEQPGYDRHCRNLSAEERAAKEAEGIDYVVRLKVPLDGKVVGQDMIRGEVEFDNTTLQDIVLLKSDGFPTYHLAHVIDDHFMEISHVTRAIEWLPSLPVHLHLWDAFGWEIPKYAHLPVLLNPNGKGKLSKRHAGFSEDGAQILVLVQEFIDAGYYAPAVVNFLTNIGWNFGDDQEIFSLEETVKRFDLKDVQAGNSAYPIDKLDWINGMYIREKMTSDELAEHLVRPLEKAGYTVDMDVLRKVAPVVQTRLKTFNDIVDMAGFFFADEFTQADAETIVQKKMDVASSIDALEKIITVAEEQDDYSTDALLQRFDELNTELGLKRGQTFGLMRVAVTGQKISPPTFETMEILGKEECIKRMKSALEVLQAAHNS